MSMDALLPSSSNETQDPGTRDTDPPAESQLMLLPDGRIFAHHLTPGLAELLDRLTNPKAESSDTPNPPSPSPNVLLH